MKRDSLLYLIVFLLIVVIGFQGYYFYNQNHIKREDSLLVPKSYAIKSLKDENLNSIFSSNPFEQMQKMEQNMQKVFNSMNSQFASMPEFEKFFKNDMSISPAMNMKSYKDRYELSVSIPGSDKNDISVKTKDGILTIEAKTSKKKDEKKSNFMSQEIYEGSFARSISLPSDADSSKMSTKYKNGILKIILPRKK